MSLLKKLLGLEPARQVKLALNRTPEVLASLERIEARRQKELKKAEEQKRRERLLKTHTPADRINAPQSISPNGVSTNQEIKMSEVYKGNQSIDNGMTTNSRMNLWFNTIAPEDPPDTIAPDMRIPDTVFDVETNKFEK